MFEYPYTRAWLAGEGHFDICYGNLNAEPPIVEPSLNNEVFLAIGKRFQMCCEGTSCIISFEEELSGGEESQLDQLVADHKVQAANQAVFSTTQTGVLEFKTKGPAATGMWIDWGDGSAVEWIQHTGVGNEIVTNHDYSGLPGTKTIVFMGALSDVTSFDCQDTTFGGSMSSLGVFTGLTFYQIFGTLVDGDIAISTLMSGLLYLQASSSDVSGDVAGINSITGLLIISLATTNVTGDFGDFSTLVNLTYVNLSGNSLSYETTTLPAWSNTTIYLQNNAMTQTEVDNFLIDLAAAGGTNGTLNIAGTNAARSAASDAAKATLLTNGWAVTVNE